MHDAMTAGSNQDASREEVNRLLFRLDPDAARAGEKYETIRRRLVKLFVWNQCTEAEDLADEVFDRVAAKLESEDIRDIGHYALGVARYVCLEAYKRMQRESHIDDAAGGLDSLPNRQDQSSAIDERIDHENRLICLRKCLDKLMAGDRELALQYYSAEDEKQKVHRRKLEQCVRDCLESRREMLRSAS
jgi:DNA-directed RNA polymerase specialized sigma24 family protein